LDRGCENIRRILLPPMSLGHGKLLRKSEIEKEDLEQFFG
jgi:hypothetical protein